MDKFRKNDVEGSVADFDAALAARAAMRPYLWQRGLSLYYLQQYEEGAQQFRDDVAVNPNDTEESIWAFLCEAQMVGADKARAQFLQVGRDPRPVMRAAYECFKTWAQPEAILQAAGGDRQGHDAFYAQLYMGLWHEAHGNTEAAQAAITEAVRTLYGRSSGDYMAALAAVHCQRRGWQV
ncbi:TPR repeat [Micractinium conductrix]|uniref:TPR repeat n=1 Tax=Micractinium conductrix TaxID=554055 RepID=A0A2P6V8C4_9CHLO|nr:TPR repeat [Micractinium conductrix]|eukprot:PSC70340.1 TPR repeat [Micractinium conductrix]